LLLPGHTVPASLNNHAVQPFRILMQSEEDVSYPHASKLRTSSMSQNTEFQGKLA